MIIKPAPGYEGHLLSYYNESGKHSTEELNRAREQQGKAILNYCLPEGMTMEDITISGPDEGQTLKLRTFRPSGLPPKAPVVLDIHGGGFVGGNLDIDNYRCIALAQGTPCLVYSVEYRLSNKDVHFPAPLMDCLTAFLWIRENAELIGADADRIALHGTSAGATLSAGLALYLRDKFFIKPALTIINCPVLTLGSGARISAYQNAAYSLDPPDVMSPPFIYVGDLDGKTPSYYAFPGYCPSFEQLGPHAVVVAEYDAFRDEGVEYAVKLMRAGVPCEMIAAPRVGHGFCTIDEELTRLVHGMMCYSLRREFSIK